MLFKDRKDAAKKLIPLLKNYKNDENTIILALPRGGIIVGNIIAKNLNLKFDLIIPRKLPSPTLKELAIGAICENSVYLNEQLIKDLEVSKKYIQNQIIEEKKKIQERKKFYKKDLNLINLENKNIILVDDGIATGATMFAAILALKTKKVKTIIVCIPVGPYNTIELLKKNVDKVICPYIPPFFMGISQFYDNFEEITDEDVIEIFKK